MYIKWWDWLCTDEKPFSIWSVERSIVEKKSKEKSETRTQSGNGIKHCSNEQSFSELIQWGRCYAPNRNRIEVLDGIPKLADDDHLSALDWNSTIFPSVIATSSISLCQFRSLEISTPKALKEYWNSNTLAVYWYWRIVQETLFPSLSCFRNLWWACVLIYCYTLSAEPCGTPA